MSMTYISSQAITSSSRQAVMQAQVRLADLNTELSSGTYADVGLQIGSRSGQLLSLTTQTSNLQSISDNNALTSTRLSTAQTALSSMRDAASKFLASLTQAQSAGNATAGIQGTASGNLKALISALNTSVDDQHVFGGINTGEAPIAAYVADSASKTAVDQAFSAKFGTSQTDAGASSISGAAMQDFLSTNFAPLFSATSYATTWSVASDEAITSRIAPEQSITTSVSANNPAFRQLAQAYAMVSEFGGSPLNAQANQAAITTATSLVTSAISGLTDVQAGLGVAQSTVSSANDTLSAQIDLLTAQSGSLGQLSDTSLYDIKNETSLLSTQIQASYSITVKLQEMSLANYIH